MLGVKMDLAMLSLLLVLQSPILSSGFVAESKICGDLVVYSNSYGLELFRISGNSVGKRFFCEALEAYREKDCKFVGNLKSDHCQLDLSTDGFLSISNRRILQQGLGHEPVVPKERSGSGFSSSRTKTGVLAAGSVLTCCIFLCPCFFKRRRDAADAVLTKDSNSMESVSSFEMGSTHEKIPQSPYRSHEKIPQSPYRVPRSPRYSMSPQLSRLGSVHLNMNQVARATRNFSPSLRIGEGGFGTVYKAQLEDGNVVAIKRGKKEQFENLRNEFSSEIELLAKIDHRNLVKLLGYVDQGNELLIITEYVPNGTLREHLDGLRGKILDFNQRLEIAIDVAHGLTYLHQYAEKQIIHRDVKSSNILLTESMRAKVADFGFAKLGPTETDETHIVTKVKGTVGYLDPEYMKTYQLTAKSDVYSFGILLIEILTGRRPVEMKRPAEERVTLKWAFNRYDDGRVFELVDPLMAENVIVENNILRKIFGLAMECASPIRSQRPDMKQVSEQLWTIRADYIKSTRRG